MAEEWTPVEEPKAEEWTPVEEKPKPTAPSGAQKKPGINLLESSRPLDLSYLKTGAEAPPIAPGLAKFQPGSVSQRAQSHLEQMAPRGFEELGEQAAERVAPISELQALRNWDVLLPHQIGDVIDRWQPADTSSAALKGAVEFARGLQKPENLAFIALLKQAPPGIKEVAGQIFRAQMLEGGGQAGINAAYQYLAGNAPAAAMGAVQSVLSVGLGGVIPEAEAKQIPKEDFRTAFGDGLPTQKPRVITPTEILPGTASTALREKTAILSKRPPRPVPQEPVATPAGDVVQPNIPASPLVERLLKEKIAEQGGDPNDPQSVADTVADVRALPRQEIRVADIPVSQTETVKSGKTITTIPPEATTAAIVHEMEHVEEAQGGPPVPEGTQETAAAGFIAEPPVDRELVIADKLTPGLYSWANEPSAAERAEMNELRLNADNADVVRMYRQFKAEGPPSSQEEADLRHAMMFNPPVGGGEGGPPPGGGGGGFKMGQPPAVIPPKETRGYWRPKVEDPYAFYAGYPKEKQYQTDWGGKQIPQDEFLSNMNRTLKAIVTTFFEPRFQATNEQLDIVGKMMGARSKMEVYLAKNRLINEMEKKIDKLSPQEQVAFLDREHYGQKHPEPWMNLASTFMRTMEDRQLKEVRKLQSPFGMTWYRENHVGMRWLGQKDETGRLIEFRRDVYDTPRPLAGGAAFTKQASDLPPSVLMDMDYVPEDLNKVRLWKAGMMAKVRYQATLKAMRRALATGQVVESEHAPLGYEPLDDRFLALREHLKDTPAGFNMKEMGMKMPGATVGKITPGAEAGIVPRPDMSMGPARPLGPPDVAGPGEPLPEMPERTRYYAEENFARMLNNIMSVDRIRANDIARPLLAAKFMLTGYELAFAAPHAWHVGGILTPMMDMAEAVARAWNGGIRGEGVSGGLKARAELVGDQAINALKAMIPGYSAGKYGQLGSKVVQIIANPEEFMKAAGTPNLLKKFPEFERFAHALFDNNMRYFWDETQTQDQIRKISQYWDTDQNGRMVRASLGLAMDGVSNVLLTKAMFHGIRFDKIGASFTHFANGILNHADDLASGKMDESQIARDAINLADNVLGNVDYTNSWFMNRTGRGILQGLFRAPAFFMGFMKYVGSALHGQFKEIMDVHDYINGLREPTAPRSYIPRIDPKFAGLATMLIPAGIYAAIYQMRHTGEAPNELIDTFYPKNGTIDARGNEGRTAIFGFPKELYNWVRGGVKLVQGEPGPLWTTFRNKFAGWISHMTEVANKKDFYNRDIWEPNDPGYMQMLKGAAHIIGTPIVQSSLDEARRREMSPGDLVLTALGWRPAPTGLLNDQMDDYVDEAMRGHRPEAGLTKEQYEQRQQISNWVTRYVNAKSDETKNLVIREATEAGMSDRAMEKFFSKATVADPQAARWSLLSWEELSRAWDLASDAKRAKLFPIVAQKIANAKPEQANFPLEAQKKLDALSAKIGLPVVQ